MKRNKLKIGDKVILNKINCINNTELVVDKIYSVIHLLSFKAVVSNEPYMYFDIEDDDYQIIESGE